MEWGLLNYYIVHRGERECFSPSPLTLKLEATGGNCSAVDSEQKKEVGLDSMHNCLVELTAGGWPLASMALKWVSIMSWRCWGVGMGGT